MLSVVLKGAWLTILDQEYLDWLDAGNTPEPVPPPEPAPILTTDQKLNAAGLTVAELKELFGLT